MQPNHPFSTTLPDQVFASRRTPVWGRKYMAATTQGPAVEAACKMLRRGGNAADAMVAAAATLAVTEPMSTGPGGDGFVLYYEAATKTVHAINGSGKSSRHLTPELVDQRGLGGQLPTRHALTVNTPGVVGLWCDLIESHGSKDLAQVLEPAIETAEQGFILGPVAGYLWGCGADQVLRTAPGGEHFLYGGEPPKAGDILYNKDLAQTLRELATASSPAAARQRFYQGDIAQRIATAVHDAGGVLDADDLAAHQSLIETPISTEYRGKRIYQCPPNGQGLTGLIALNILKELPFTPGDDPYTPQRLHVLIEALRLAFADARRFVACPEQSPAPLERLLSPEHAKAQAALVRMDKAGSGPDFSVPLSSSDTVYLCAVDDQGNACSMVNSVYMNFGTGIVPERLGFSLQNRGACFTPIPGHPNALGPNKRSYHTIIPGMATFDDTGELYGPFGVMGGFMQPQGHVQVLTALLDDGLDPQSALDRLRFCIRDGDPAAPIAMEHGIPTQSLSKLKSMGHCMEVLQGFGRALMGRGQIILRDPTTGHLCAGSDPRGDGMAFGY